MSAAKDATTSRAASATKKTGSRIPLAQRRKARRLILQALYQWLLAGADVAEISRQFREEHTGKMDWDYFDAVFTAIPGEAERLDQTLLPCLDRELRALDPVEKALLYLGTYEMIHRIDVPYRVVINECVELAKVFGATESHKYINGVLDRLAPKLRPHEWQKRN